jgi:hypothetical protein
VSQNSSDPCGASLDATDVSDTVRLLHGQRRLHPDRRRHDIGTLSIPSSQSTTATVQLIGTATGSSTGGGSTDLALNAPVTASSTTSGFPATNAVDGNTSTYWESTDATWPSTLSVDLGVKTR